MTRPDNNPKSVFGMAKPGIHAIPPVALLHLGRGMEDGESKYGLANWRENNVSAKVYYDAVFRHLAAWWDGEKEAPDSKVHHLGHVMACCAILLDAEAGRNLIDDRPKVPGKFSEMVKNMTRSPGNEKPVIKVENQSDTPEISNQELGEAVDRFLIRSISTGRRDTLGEFLRSRGVFNVFQLRQEDRAVCLKMIEVVEEATDEPDIYNQKAHQSDFENPEDDAPQACASEKSTNEVVAVPLRKSVSLQEIFRLMVSFEENDPTGEKTRRLETFRKHIGYNLEFPYYPSDRSRTAFYIDAANLGLNLDLYELDDALRVAGFNFKAE